MHRFEFEDFLRRSVEYQLASAEVLAEALAEASAEGTMEAMVTVGGTATAEAKATVGGTAMVEAKVTAGVMATDTEVQRHPCFGKVANPKLPCNRKQNEKMVVMERNPEIGVLDR